ncbi:unnamed protein product [Owenia fusiformis]|uniref:Sushi domain-containing protein n=1 Tax=Owenia fusiformis TaxID=6347 RepID=A0A8S4NM91_OWEFU|nr:unnamed protein product [Owenia fusiformis]
MDIWTILCFVFCLTTFAQAHPRKRENNARIRRATKDFNLHRDLVEKADVLDAENCHSRVKRSKYKQKIRHPSRLAQHHHSEHANLGKGLYFSGERERLSLKLDRSGKFPGSNNVIPAKEFTVSIWVKPEGGQYFEVPIIRLRDDCTGPFKGIGWTVGIQTTDEHKEKAARFYFSLQSTRNRQPSIIFAKTSYKPNIWTNLVATYDGKRAKFFIDGAKVGVSNSQKGEVYHPIAEHCGTISIGGTVTGNSDGDEGSFRGTIESFTILPEALKHHSIIHNPQSLTESPDAVYTDTFDDLSNWLQEKTTKAPKLVDSDIQVDHHDLAVVSPPCGQTICDDPNVVKSYSAHWELRKSKSIRYRVINIMHDDGSDPTVTVQQISRQHKALNKAFRPYNISFILQVENVRNTSLRQRTVLFGCLPDHVGDDKCHPECNIAITGYDGGDCREDTGVCDPATVGNMQCDDSCNTAYYQWDGGDCCDAASDLARCFDPKSQNRAYVTITEYKESIGIDGKDALNIHFANWDKDQMIAKATFPWEKHVFGITGGTVIKPSSFGMPGKMDNLIHEIGHNLGLLHVHHGVTGVDCMDPCREIKASMELGDLCSDTNPTVTNSKCADPDPVDQCGVLTKFINTPFNNYMSYADGDDCTDSFTKQQMARMHCYLDLVYLPWQTIQRPSPIPLPPQVITTSHSSVSIVWIPPMSPGFTGVKAACSECLPNKSLVQYASIASSPNSPAVSGYWSPEQTTGPPDAELCEASTKAWIPLGAKPYGCDTVDCYIEVEFKYPAIAHRLLIWVAWNAEMGLKNIELVFKDGKTLSLGPADVFCDIPYTTTLDIKKEVSKVRIHVYSRFTSIDAVQLVSFANHAICKPCKPVKYNIVRSPPFPDSDKIIVNEPKFVDKDVSDESTYTYKIQAITGAIVSQFSPELVYTVGNGHCGDGIIDRLVEECDDNNLASGDGCSFKCKRENGYHCTGEPSQCYYHDGDGMCEDFERISSIKDCGVYTPDGFVDQWSSNTTGASLHKDHHCLYSTLSGPPDTSHICMSSLGDNTIDNSEDEHCLTFPFSMPMVSSSIVLHIAADGVEEYDESKALKSISVTLIDTEGNTHDIGGESVAVRCKDSPIEIGCQHDLSKPFFLTQAAKVRYQSGIEISGVALRSRKSLLMDEDCQKSDLFNPRTGHCSSYRCKEAVCDKFNVKHGVAKCTGHKDEDTCKIECNAGYHLNIENHNLVCVNGKWKGPHVECSPRSCGDPQIDHATFTCDGTHLGSVCTFKCAGTARLVGTNRRIRCEADGLWSQAEAYCQVRCNVPKKVKNAALISKSCKHGLHDVDTICKFKCNKGYHVQGLPFNKRIAKQKCVESGKWDGPMCVKVTCPPIDDVYMGLYNCTNGFNFGSTCTLKCPEIPKTISKTTCSVVGRWNKRIKACTFGNGRCSALENSVRGMKFICGDNHIGSKCQPVCVNPQLQPMLDNENRATWEKLTSMKSNSITSITCTGLLKWYPRVSSIRCEEGCTEATMGDGWCDAENNKARCDFDGGDCCESTVAGHVVKPFLDDCLDACNCKDPDANKNSQRIMNDSIKQKKLTKENEEILEYWFKLLDL